MRHEPWREAWGKIRRTSPRMCAAAFAEWPNNDDTPCPHSLIALLFVPPARNHAVCSASHVVSRASFLLRVAAYHGCSLCVHCREQRGRH